MRKWTRRGRAGSLHSKELLPEGGNRQERLSKKTLALVLEANEPIQKSKASGRPGTLDLPATHDGWAQGISED